MPYSKILVVDDEPDLQALIMQKFRKEIKENQYDFAFADNGVQALNKINEDLITDINVKQF